MKKIFIVLFCTILFFQAEAFAKASYTTLLNKGNQLLNEQKYTPAIISFNKAIKLAPDNQNARIGIAKSYIERANNYMNKDKEYGKAANDYRCALYYLQYFAPKINNDEIEKLSADAEDKLNICYKKLHFKKNAEARYDIAELLRIAEIYAAAGYEYNQAAKDKSLTEKCNKKLDDIVKTLNRN